MTFTGQFDLPREEWERRAMAVGLSVGGVTKKSVLLVAANPDSMSGKARKAREYGIPIIGETAFARLLGNMSGGGQLVEQDLSAQPAELDLTETYGIFPWSIGVSGTSAHTGTKALAVEWCAKHPRRRLLELSPQLTPFSEIEVQSSYKSGYTQWFARFPQPLEATVEDLRDLPGVGEHKLVAMVEAVVLAASDSGNAAVIDSIGAAENPYGDIPIGDNPFSDDDSAGRAAEFLGRTSEEIRALDQAALYIGWAQLNGAVVEVASLPSAVAAEVPIISAHLEHQSPVRALFQRAVGSSIEPSAVMNANAESLTAGGLVRRRWIPSVPRLVSRARGSVSWSDNWRKILRRIVLSLKKSWRLWVSVPVQSCLWMSSEGSYLISYESQQGLTQRSVKFSRALASNGKLLTAGWCSMASLRPCQRG